MSKIDFKKKFKDLYNPKKNDFYMVDVPEMNFLMIDGKGDPNTSQEYKDAISTLFPLAYGIKFHIKKTQEIDYGVMPLEGLWWIENMEEFNTDDKSNWLWTSLIMQPEFVTREIFDEVFEEVGKKKNPPSIDKIRFESFKEGKAMQFMHVGAFSEEGPYISKMHKLIKEKGYKLSGKHHEIYLKDFNKTKSENLLTVVRQPFSK